jgi:hypothetical protein
VNTYKEQEALQESIRVRGIKLGFKDITNHANYTDSHTPLAPFGARWGRGVLIRKSGRHSAIVGSYGTSHAQLKRGLEPGESSVGTFYYGYDTQSRTIYFEYGSDRTFEFTSKPVLAAIMDALQYSPGFMRNFITE